MIAQFILNCRLFKESANVCWAHVVLTLYRPSTRPFVQFHYNVVYLIHFKKYNLQYVGSIRFTNQRFITCSQFQVTQDKGYTPWDRSTDDAWLYFGLISNKHKAT